MTRPIEIRAYIVGFGDCLLLKVPDGRQTSHVLIDFGRAPNDAASLERFPAIASDIAKQCNGHLDLVVVTHEHLDHLEGFYRQRAIFDQLQVDQVWMGLPSHPDYYARYPNACPQKKLQEAVGRFALSASRRGLVLHPSFQSLIENNLTNKDRIDYLRRLGTKPPVYLARGKAGNATSKLFRNIKVQVLAPEEDTSVYYGTTGRAQARMAALAATHGFPPGAAADDSFSWDFKSVSRAVDGDLPGFSASDFERLRHAIREDGVAAARFIDRAQNNTSLCLLIEAAGKRLLFPGDAELESWDMMQKHCKAQLKPVDFLKVSHHGSHNGTPLDLLDQLLPVKRASKAKVLVSTKRNVYGTKFPVPDAGVLKELRRRCSELLTTDGVQGTHVDIQI